MEKNRIFDKNNLKVISFLCGLLALVLCVIIFNAHTYRLPIFDGTRAAEEPGWYFGEKGTTLEPVELSEKQWIEPGKTYILCTELVYSGEGDDYPSAFLTVGNYQIRVFLDGELMFQYTKAERGYPRIKGMGGAAFSIPLGKNCEGREFLLELQTAMDYADARRMPGIMLGDHSAHMQDLFLTNIPSMLISLAIFFVALILVLLGNSSPQKRWAYLHFAVFALVILVYRSSQDLYLMYVWANPMVTICLEFFSLVVCPIPILLSYSYELKPYFRKAFTFLIGVSIFNGLAQLFLHFTGILDVVELLEVTHIWIIIAAISLIIIAWKVRRLDSSIHCMRKMIPIMVGAAIDFTIFYIRFHAIGPGSFFVIGNYIGLGLLASMIMLVWEARKERERSYAETERRILLEKLAYKDALTGIENRAAFTREISEIQSGNRQGRKLLAVEADLNDLKKTNDNLGHAAGDDLICRTAQLLSDCFGAYGHVYRTGGDEFYALLYGVNDAQWDNMRKEFLAELGRRNAEHRLPLSIAVGHAFMGEGTVDDCIRLADKRMYQNKMEIKGGADYGFCQK